MDLQLLCAFQHHFTFTGDKIDVKETARYKQLSAVTELDVDYLMRGNVFVVDTYSL